jgi:hypothetical protein
VSHTGWEKRMLSLMSWPLRRIKRIVSRRHAAALEKEVLESGMVHKYGDTLLPGVILAVEFQGQSLEKVSFDASLVPESGRQVLIPS